MGRVSSVVVLDKRLGAVPERSLSLVGVRYGTVKEKFLNFRFVI